MKTFKCPICGSTEFEEVIGNCTVYNKVLGVEDGELVYGETTYEDGEILHYQCSNCGELIPGVQFPEEMVAWFSN